MPRIASFSLLPHLPPSRSLSRLRGGKLPLLFFEFSRLLYRRGSYGTLFSKLATPGVSIRTSQRHRAG
jgi:hypothetical protein